MSLNNTARATEEYRIISYQELRAVPAHENKESLVRIPSYIKHKKAEYPYLREQVVALLESARNRLQKTHPQIDIEVVSAYRPLDLQTEMFEKVKADIIERTPNLCGDELLEEVHKFVAVPEVAPHPTGGAVDVTLLSTQSGSPLSMGTAYLEFDSPKLPFLAPGLTSEELFNRTLLREIMLSVGFAPYNGEWWHFSYGDREWAAFYGFARSLYNAVQFPAHSSKGGFSVSTEDAHHSNSCNELHIEHSDIVHISPGGNDTFIDITGGRSMNDRIQINQQILNAYPAIEQGGFLVSPKTVGAARLEMAGGEFCGNATRAVAALLAQDYLSERTLDKLVSYDSFVCIDSFSVQFPIEVSGIEGAILVKASRFDDWIVTVEMPIQGGGELFGRVTIESGAEVKVVHLEGISHILVNQRNLPFRSDCWKEEALAIINQAGNLSDEAIGVIWYSEINEQIEMHPVVFVKSTKTLYYETSCGSGATALAIELLRSRNNEESSCLEIMPPSGIPLKVCVEFDSQGRVVSATLEGAVSIVGAVLPQ